MLANKQVEERVTVALSQLLRHLEGIVENSLDVNEQEAASEDLIYLELLVEQKKYTVIKRLRGGKEVIIRDCRENTATVPTKYTNL